MLAYVFWHAPDPAADQRSYEHALVTFQRSLEPSEIPGFRLARAFAVDGAPWIPAARGYEDWYVVDDFAALGALNLAAVSGRRRSPHDDVAAHGTWGAAGLYAPDADDLEGLVTAEAHWFDKPRGVSYEELRSTVAAGTDAAVWQRQMVLGPSPEFCALGTRPGALDVTTVRRTLLEA